MIADYDLDLLFSRVCDGKNSLSETELSVFDPLPEHYFDKDGQQPVFIADALLRFNEGVSGLIQNGKNFSRFSAEYIHTSKLIRNSVTILGQGLITLHKEGFDLSTYPLTIRELRCIASFHFGKTIDGAQAACAANPKVYFRCMEESMEWIKLLYRLEITERRLSEPVKAVPAPRPVLEAAVPAAAPITEAPILPEAQALPPMHALSPLSESKKKELTFGNEFPEVKPEPVQKAEKSEKTEKTEKSGSVKADHSSVETPYTLDAYTLPAGEIPEDDSLFRAMPGRPRAPARGHPPWED